MHAAFKGQTVLAKNTNTHTSLFVHDFAWQQIDCTNVSLQPENKKTLIVDICHDACRDIICPDYKNMVATANHFREQLF